MAYYNGSIPYVSAMNITKARQVIIQNATASGQPWAAAANTNINNDAWWTAKAASASPVADFNYTYNNGNLIRQQIGTLLSSCAALIGIHVVVYGISWANLITALMDWNSQKRFPLYAMGWMPDFNDPDDYARPLLVPGALSSDFSHTNDAYVNQSVDNALLATTTAGRQAAYNDLMNYTQNYLYPLIFLHQGQVHEVWTDNVQGYVLNLMTQPYFYGVSLTSSGISAVPGFDVTIVSFALIMTSIMAIVIVRKKIRM